MSANDAGTTRPTFPDVPDAPLIANQMLLSDPTVMSRGWEPTVFVSKLVPFGFTRPTAPAVPTASVS